MVAASERIEVIETIEATGAIEAVEAPLVSIVIPVYNASKYLAQGLDCLRSQTYTNWEAICVNDGSKDDSLEILQRYAQEDKRIRIIDQPNGGAGNARNHGLKEARGEYLSILDSDDLFDSRMLERMIGTALKADTDMVVCRADQLNEAADTYEKTNWTVKADQFPKTQPFSAIQIKPNIFVAIEGWTWDKLIKRSLVEQYDITFQEQRIYNDLLFTFSVYVLSMRIAFLDEVLVHQRKRADESSLSDTASSSWSCMFHALSALEGVLKKYNLIYAYERDFVNYVVQLTKYQLSISKPEDQEALKEAARTKWFSELGVTDKECGYFYSKDLYELVQNILEDTCQAASNEMGS